MPEVTEGRRLGRRAGKEPLSAARIEDLFVGVLDLHPRAVEVDPAGVEVAHLVAGEHLRFQKHIVVVERD